MCNRLKEWKVRNWCTTMQKPKRLLCKYVTEIKLKKLILLRKLSSIPSCFSLYKMLLDFLGIRFLFHTVDTEMPKGGLYVHVVLFETKQSFKISSFHTIMASPLYWFALYIMQCVLIVMYINNDKFNDNLHKL